MRKTKMAAYEQYMLELVNNYRVDNGVQPVASYAPLESSSDEHSAEILATDTFQHEMDLAGLISDNGFEWRAGYYGIFENHQWRWGYPGDMQQQVLDQFNSYVASTGHNENILNPEHEMAGMSVMTGNYQGLDGAIVTTQHFAWNEREAFLLGVAFDDQDGDALYDVGEGLAKINVRVVDEAGNVFRTKTDANGGYAMELGAGDYDVSFLKGKTVLGTDSVLLADLNHKSDLMI